MTTRKNYIAFVFYTSQLYFTTHKCIQIFSNIYTYIQCIQRIHIFKKQAVFPKNIEKENAIQNINEEAKKETAIKTERETETEIEEQKKEKLIENGNKSKRSYIIFYI